MVDEMKIKTLAIYRAYCQSFKRLIIFSQWQPYMTMITIKAYTTNNRYFIDGKEVFGDKILGAAIFGETKSKEMLLCVVEGKNKKQAWEKLGEELQRIEFKGTVTRHKIF